MHIKSWVEKFKQRDWQILNKNTTWNHKWMHHLEMKQFRKWQRVSCDCSLVIQKHVLKRENEKLLKQYSNTLRESMDRFFREQQLNRPIFQTTGPWHVTSVFNGMIWTRLIRNHLWQVPWLWLYLFGISFMDYVMWFLRDSIQVKAF